MTERISIKSENDRPVIGITPSKSEKQTAVNTDYLRAVFASGGIPFLLPAVSDPGECREYVRACSGLLLTGGVDIAPERYGETKQFDSVEVDEDRDAFEFAVFDAFYRAGKPIFGICRGIQLINVALGGTLYQHIEGHNQPEARREYTRSVSVVPGTRLDRIIGADRTPANSFHHQAVKKAAPGLTVSAFAADGTAEAVEGPEERGFLLGVQWHPEIICDRDAGAKAMFDAFVRECRARELKELK